MTIKQITDDEILDIVRYDADLDWHAGFTYSNDENRYVTLARAIELLAFERMRDACAETVERMKPPLYKWIDKKSFYEACDWAAAEIRSMNITPTDTGEKEST